MDPFSEDPLMRCIHKTTPTPWRGSRLLRSAAFVAVFSVLPAAPSSAQVVSGGYIGDGNDNVQIDQLGFQPDVVIVKGDTTQIGVVRTSTMAGDLAKPMTGATALTADLVQSLDTRGFTIGSDARVNSGSIDYYFIAFKEAAKRMKVGTYTGTGSSQSVTGVGFSPDLVVIIPENAAEVVYRSTADTETFNFATSSGLTSITALGADGFTVASALSASGVTYHYIAWNEVAGVMDVAAYTGNGTDNTNRTEPGFRPEYVIVKRDGFSAAVQHPASLGPATDSTLYFNANGAVTNRIQQLTDDGFQIGTGAEVNTSSSGYHYFAWRRTLPDMQVISGSYTGNGTAGRAITGLGFSPDAVLIKSSTTQAAVFRSWTNYGDITSDLSTGAAVANLVQTLDAGGFTIGNDARVNSNGVTYNWVAWQRGAGQMEVGTYTGNGSAGRQVTDLGFSPDFVIVIGYIDQPVYRNAAGTYSYAFNGSASTSWITALGTDGFTLSSDARVNSSGYQYAWVAWDEVAGLMDVGSYSGNGADNRNITGVGFLPQFAWTQSDGGQLPVAHSLAMGTTTDASHFFDATANATDQIQALQTDGFQVGSAVESNESGKTFVYAAWATNAITAVDMVRMSANRTPDGVRLEWRTGYEVSNLGFHIYREKSGEKVRLTGAPIKGASLLLGPDSERMNGFSYRWTDRNAGPEEIRYWIEDLDLNGSTTMHGPVIAREESRREVAGPALGWQWGASLEDSAAPGNTIASPTPPPAGRAPGLAASQTALPPASQASEPGAQDSPARVAVGQPPIVVAAPPPGRLRVAAPDEIKQWIGGGTRTMAPEVQAQWRLAGRAAARLRIREAGWYRVSQPQLVAAGIDPAVDPRRLQLFLNGLQQPIVVHGEADGQFDAGDAVEFYGEGTDTPYTDSRIYWLTVADTAGARIAAIDAAPRGTAPPASFPYTVERKDRIIYFAALLNGEAENFFGELITGDYEVEQPLQVSELDRAGSPTARLEVRLQGVTDDPETSDHLVTVRINGRTVGTISFAGRDQATGAWDIDVGWLADGENIVGLQGRSEFDYTLVDLIRLTHLRHYTPENGQLRATVAAGNDVVVGPFSSSVVRLIDVTDAAHPTELAGAVQAGAGGFLVRAYVAGTGTRSVLALSPEGMKAPAEVASNTPSAWHRDAVGADLVVISHAAFLPSLQPLEQFREQQGHRVVLVDVEDVYDEFSFGEKTPFALRRFLAQTYRRTTMPRYVLLVGNATQDPRDYFGFGEPDYVPTKLVPTTALETASDDWFADADGDRHAELGILGRLPVRSAYETAVIVNKILEYEQGSDAPWTKSVLLVAQPPGPGDFDYEGASAALKPLIPSDYTVTALDSPGTPRSREDVIARINDGQMLVNFIGHGSVEQWGGDLLFGSDVPTLTNASRLPLVVAMNCLNGFFFSLFPEESLAESLLRAPNGGAVAVWASSSVTSPSWQTLMNRELVRQMFGGSPRSLGEMVAAAKRIVGDPDVRQSWILFGDPLTRPKGIPGEQARRPEPDPSRLSSADPAPLGDGDRDDGDPAATARLLSAPRQRIVDFNADGLADLLLYNADAGEWRIAFNSTSGFELKTRVQGVPVPPYAARLNDDELMDVFWYDPKTGVWVQALNLGQGAFALSSGAWGTGWQVLVADFSGDRRDDVWLHEPATGAWFEHRSDGAGGFIARSGGPLPVGTARVVDLNADRVADLLIDGGPFDGWSAALSTEDGQWVTVSLPWDPGLHAQPGDLNGDGRTDFVLWHPESATWLEVLSRTPGRFTYVQRERTVAGAPYLIDLGGDGRDDVLWYEEPSGAWQLQLSAESGNAIDLSGTWGKALQITSGKVDADAAADLFLYDPASGAWTRVSLISERLIETLTGSLAAEWSVLGARE
jgi:hypothetical protein